MAARSGFREKINDIKMQKETILAIFQEGDGDPGLFDELFNVYLNLIDWVEKNQDALFNEDGNEQLIMEVMDETECGNKLKKAYLDKYQRGKITFVNFLREVCTAFREGQGQPQGATSLPHFGGSPPLNDPPRVDTSQPGISSRHSERERLGQGARPQATPQSFQNVARSLNQFEQVPMSFDGDRRMISNPSLDRPRAEQQDRGSNRSAQLSQVHSSAISGPQNASRDQAVSLQERAQGSQLSQSVRREDSNISSQMQRPRPDDRLKPEEKPRPDNRLDDPRNLSRGDDRRPGYSNDRTIQNDRSMQNERSHQSGQSHNSRVSDFDKLRMVSEFNTANHKHAQEPASANKSVTQDTIPKYQKPPVDPQEDGFDYLGQPISKQVAKVMPIGNFSAAIPKRDTFKEIANTDAIKKVKADLKARVAEAQKEAHEIDGLAADQKARELTLLRNLEAHKEAGIQAELQKKRTELALQRAKKEKEDLKKEIRQLANQSSNLGIQVEEMRRKLGETDSKELSALKNKKKNLTDQNNELDIELSQIKREIENLFKQMRQDGFNPGPMPFEEASATPVSQKPLDPGHVNALASSHSSTVKNAQKEESLQQTNTFNYQTNFY